MALSANLRSVARASIRRSWGCLPAELKLSPVCTAYGRFINELVRRHSKRRQYFGTHFLRNRPELELLRRLVDQKTYSERVVIAVLGCSKGAEVYSISWTIRSARPDLKLTIYAVDISQEILEFARMGVYAYDRDGDPAAQSDACAADLQGVARNTSKDQCASIFDRLSDEEMTALFDMEDDLVKIKPRLKDGIIWLCRDAGDPQLVDDIGGQDIVVANRFLCHMPPLAAEECLGNLARLVRPGGYLFVSGVDLDVRTKVAIEKHWIPVTELVKEIHEGDRSLIEGWPLEYWGLEPFCRNRPDWKIRYASVFQIGEAS